MLDSLDPLTAVPIWDPSEWRCCGVVPTTFRLLSDSVQGVRHFELPGSSGVVFQLCMEDRPSWLTFSARRGFPHLTLEKLHLLWNEYGIDVAGRKPHLLADMLRAVCEWFLGKLSPQEWAHIESRRRAITQREMWHSVVEENPDLVRDFCHEQDMPEVQKPCKSRAPRPTDAPAATGGATSVTAGGSGCDPCPAASSCVGRFSLHSRRAFTAKPMRPRCCLSARVPPSRLSTTAHGNVNISRARRLPQAILSLSTKSQASASSMRKHWPKSPGGLGASTTRSEGWRHAHSTSIPS